MTKLAPILKEISKNVRVGGYDGSRSHDGKLHETFALSRRSGRGPKSIIWTPAMAKHNSRGLSCHNDFVFVMKNANEKSQAKMLSTNIMRTDDILTNCFDIFIG